MRPGQLQLRLPVNLTTDDLAKYRPLTATVSAVFFTARRSCIARMFSVARRLSVQHTPVYCIETAQRIELAFVAEPRRILHGVTMANVGTPP